MNHLPILFEDGEALVIDKPAGLPLDMPRAGGVSLDNYLPGLRLGFAREPQPVHRLTSHEAVRSHRAHGDAERRGQAS